MKRSPINKLSKHPAAEYSRQATKWWRMCVRLIWRDRCAFHKDHHVCRYFHDRNILEAHHIIPKSVSELHRHDPTNGIMLCPGVHDWAEAHNEEFLKKLKHMWPAVYAVYKENMANRHSVTMRAHNYKEKVEELKALHKQLAEDMK